MKKTMHMYMRANQLQQYDDIMLNNLFGIMQGKLVPKCRSPGLVVMGDNSCLRGCGFESWHCILDGHFSH